MLSLRADNETYVVEGIDESVTEAFRMMAGEAVRSVDRKRFEESIGNPRGSTGVTVIVGLSGDLQGSVSLCLPPRAAILWTAQVIDYETDEIDQTVIDAVGELANLVVGGSKRRLSRFDLTMGLPSVVRAGRESLAFPTKTASVQIDYEYGDTEFSVVLSLGESLNGSAES